MALVTKYENEEIPHSEYPRPQFKRDSYLCLNGKWKLKKMKIVGDVCVFEGDIVVPFSPETIKSGIGDGFSLGTDEKLVYEKTVFIDEKMLRGVTIIHFGAVDQECDVFVNSQKVAHHRGGYTPFCDDISSALREGNNDLRVECVDKTEASHGARGKQSSAPGKIWYTAQSGVWQSVWLESMPMEYIKSIKVTPLKNLKEVKIEGINSWKKRNNILGYL